MSRGQHGLDVTRERVKVLQRKLDSAGLVYVDPHEREVLAREHGVLVGLLLVAQTAQLAADDGRMPRAHVREVLAHAVTSAGVTIDKTINALSHSRRTRHSGGGL